MRKVLALALAILLLVPSLAFADAATDAALGLGAFTVFNQIVGGVGLFGHSPALVVVAPPPPVIERRVVVIREYRPVPVYHYSYWRPAPVVLVHGHPGWCPPGLAKKGRC
jgi:hypothetical protein